MPPLVIAAGIAAGASIYGAHKQSSSANKAAQLTSQSATHAADVQAHSMDEALAFEREQAQNAFANSEAARRGNYDQWAARERRLGTIGEALGWGARPVPGYVAGVDPGFGPGTVGSYLQPPAAGGAPMPPGAVPRRMPAQVPIAAGVTLRDPYRVGPIGSYL